VFSDSYCPFSGGSPAGFTPPERNGADIRGCRYGPNEDRVSRGRDENIGTYRGMTHQFLCSDMALRAETAAQAAHPSAISRETSSVATTGDEDRLHSLR